MSNSRRRDEMEVGVGESAERVRIVRAISVSMQDRALDFVSCSW